MPRTLPPSQRQLDRARAIAISHDIFPGMITTRAERDRAIQQLMAQCTSRRQAGQVLSMIWNRPWACGWREKTVRFRHDHANQVRRLQGQPEVAWHYTLAGWQERRGWRARPLGQTHGPLTEEDQRLVDLIVFGFGRLRMPARDCRAYMVQRETRADPVWGPLLVGEW